MQKLFFILILFISLTTSSAFSMFNSEDKFIELLDRLFDGLEDKILDEIFIKCIEENMKAIIAVIPKEEVYIQERRLCFFTEKEIDTYYDFDYKKINQVLVEELKEILNLIIELRNKFLHRGNVL